MDTEVSRSMLETEFSDIDAKEAWPLVFQVAALIYFLLYLTASRAKSFCLLLFPLDSKNVSMEAFILILNY